MVGQGIGLIDVAEISHKSVLKQRVRGCTDDVTTHNLIITLNSFSSYLPSALSGFELLKGIP